MANPTKSIAALAELKTLAEQNGALLQQLADANAATVEVAKYTAEADKIAEAIIADCKQAGASIKTFVEALAAYDSTTADHQFPLHYLQSVLKWYFQCFKADDQSLYPIIPSTLPIFSADTVVLDLRHYQITGFTSLNSWLANLPKLKSIIGLNTCVDFSEVTNMGKLFAGDTSLEELDFSNCPLCFSFDMFGYNNRSTAGMPPLRSINFLGSYIQPNAKYPSLFMNQVFSEMPTLTDFVNGLTYDEVVEKNIKIWDGFGCDWEVTSGGTVTTTPWAFFNLPNLNLASRRAIINGLCDRTGQTAYTFQGLRGKLTDNDIAVATAKNWTLA